MKTLLKAAACLLATSLLSASAAETTRLAVFNGFANRLVQGSYMADLNGNTVNSDGTVTIGSTPIFLSCTGSAWSGGPGSSTGTLTDNTGISILMKYTGRPTTSANASLFTTTLSSQSYTCALGCSVQSDYAVRGMWRDSSWGTAATELPTAGYVVMTYYYDSTIGTTVYYATNATDGAGYTTSSLYSAASLCSSGNVGETLYFGGVHTNTFLATGLTIEGIAVYQGCLTSDEITTAVSDYEDFVSSDPVVSVSDSETTISSLNSAISTSLAGSTPTYVNVRVADGTTITLDADWAYTNVTLICDGTVTLAAGSASTLTANVSVSNLVLNTGVTLVFADSASCSTVISGAGAVEIPSGVSVTLSGASSYTGGTLLNGVVTIGSTNALGTGTVSGAGQVLITDASYVPYATLSDSTYTDYNPLGVTFTDTAWTGTVTLRGFTATPASGSTKFQRYSLLANANSTLEIDGTSGYFKPSDTTTAKEIRISQTTSSGSAYGLHANNGNSGTYATFIGKLTGDGPITMSGSSSPRFCFGFVGDCSEWTGDLTVENRYRLAFAASEDDMHTCTNNTTDLDNYLLVSTNMNVSTWTLSSASGRVDVLDGVTLCASSNTTITVSNITFAATATISLTDTSKLYAEQCLWTGGDGVSAVYRIPALATAPNGDLIAACDARIPRNGDLHAGYKIRIPIRRSSDGGETWTDATNSYEWVWDGSDSTASAGTSASDPSFIVDEANGKVFLFYNVMDHVNAAQIYQQYVQTSTDNGATWSEPYGFMSDLTNSITANANFSDWNFGGTKTNNGQIFITSGSGIKTSNGTLLHTIVHVNDATVALFGSTDGGATWQIFGNPVGPGDECKVVELTDGTLMINSRYSAGGGRYIHTTKDWGETWTTRFDTSLEDPACNAQIMRVDDILLFSNCKCNTNSDAGRRNLHIRASNDDGATWTPGVQIREGRSIYSDMALIGDDTVGLLYEAYAADNSTFTIVFTKVPLEDITAQLNE